MLVIDADPQANATLARGRRGVVLRLLRSDAPAGVYGGPEAWPRWEQLLPHVLTATAHVAEDPRQLAQGVTDRVS